MKRTFGLSLGSLKKTLAPIPSHCNRICSQECRLHLVQLGQQRSAPCQVCAAPFLSTNVNAWRQSCRWHAGCP